MSRKIGHYFLTLLLHIIFQFYFLMLFFDIVVLLCFFFYFNFCRCFFTLSSFLVLFFDNIFLRYFWRCLLMLLFMLFFGIIFLSYFPQNYLFGFCASIRLCGGCIWRLLMSINWWIWLVISFGCGNLGFLIPEIDKK